MLTTSFIAVGEKTEKGRALERLTGAVWAKLGYRKLIFNAHGTGEEIDVEGTHIISGEVLKGQCKAHQTQIDTPSLRLFLGDVEKARDHRIAFIDNRTRPFLDDRFR